MCLLIHWVNGMQLKDESILAIGMLSMSPGVLIGFLHFKYSGFAVSDFVEGVSSVFLQC